MTKFSKGNSTARKLSNEQVYEMRELYATGDWTQAALARKFQVCTNTVGMILRGESRQGVPMPFNEEEIQASMARFLALQGEAVLGKLNTAIESVPSIKAERNLKELENWDAASKFGVTKEDSQ